MTIRRRTAITPLLALGLALPALAGDWRPYANARFGYEIEVPAGFVAGPEADNGDGLRLASADGSAELLVWGTSVTEGDFRLEADDRRNTSVYIDGWTIGYEKATDTWISYSGTRDGRVLYARGIALCDGLAAFFQLTYPQADRKAYDAVIVRMVKSLKPAEGCTP
ncbi:hypothetical protein M8R20_21625 [Pseudomonas sp. R2.Fl]|nr:hypothetical protein [Pseudomonas sp. R2.Fl]